VFNLSKIRESRKPLFLDGQNLSLDDLISVTRQPGYPIRIIPKAIQRMKKSRHWVDSIQITGKPVVYGLNTGFGSKATVSIDREKLRDLQRNLIMSHAAGTGNPFPIEVVRAAMIMRINTFAKGYSGVSLEVVETLIEMLERGVTPWVPEQGSLGASGDLAPLSHIALVISTGVEKDYEADSGKAFFYEKDKRNWMLFSGQTAMQKAGIRRIILEAKDGLALNNGTQISTALLAITLYDAKRLVKQADIAMAMTLEALEGISSAFKEKIHLLRPHKGQVRTAKNIRKLIKGSKLINRNPQNIQDAYSLRCHPQVMGSVTGALEYIENVVDIEINATTDNPIILPEINDENKAISGGNFHAQPIAFASDLLSMVLCEVGSIAERRIFRLSDKNLNAGLPSFLINNSGLESGLMLAQYTAASLVSENRSLAHPASIDNIPTCENQEDHVSMAPIAARKARMILENVQKIVAIEAFYAAQALDLRLAKLNYEKSMMGKGTQEAYKTIRKHIPYINKDRPIYPQIEAATDLIINIKLLDEVEKKVGNLE
jgi:histidine ammonia-lyase